MSLNIICKIHRSDFRNLGPSPKASITNVKHLSSYNWVEAPTPTIAIPGSPPLWSNIRAPRQLKKDYGLFYIAQNAARHPESPLEPLFRALYTTDPLFDIHSIDLISDRNNIRKLLSFVDPASNKFGPEPFTIKIEIVDGTTIFCREEAEVQEYIGSHEFKGYGHQFERAYTAEQVHGSTGHHRVISYHFNGLNLMIRHETDGYIGSQTGAQSSDRNLESESLSQMLGSLSLSSVQPPGSNFPGSKLTIKMDGREVPIESTLEIKTRVRHKPLSFDEVAPQLWISQTPQLVRAYHERGKFGVPEVEDVASKIRDWEERNQSNLAKLGALIANIIEQTKESGQATLTYDVESDQLVITKNKAARMLPEYLYSKWEAVRSNSSDGVAAFDDTQSHLSSATTERQVKHNTTCETTIRIGDTTYNIPLSKLPYLSSFVHSETLSASPGAELRHDSIPLFDVALSGVSSGYRQCFRLLDNDVRRFQTLCDTYDFLKVDVLEGLSLDTIIAHIKAGKQDIELDHTGDKTLARDSAFQLVYLMLRDRFNGAEKDRNQLFNIVLYIVSHPGTFKHKTRHVVRGVYDNCQTLTQKQVDRLNEWTDDLDAEEDDRSTESEDCDDDDSDDFYYESDSS